jgi:hypothetical protein
MEVDEGSNGGYIPISDSRSGHRQFVLSLGVLIASRVGSVAFCYEWCVSHANALRYALEVSSTP